MEIYEDSFRVQELLEHRASIYLAELQSAEDALDPSIGEENVEAQRRTLRASRGIPELHLEYFRVSLHNRERTLTKMFLQPDAQLCAKALEELTGLLLSMLPLASLVEPVERLQRICQRGKDQADAAAKYTSQLDDSAESLMHWAMLSELFNVGFEHLDKEQSELEEIANLRVRNRLQTELEDGGGNQPR